MKKQVISILLLFVVVLFSSTLLAYNMTTKEATDGTFTLETKTFVISFDLKLGVLKDIYIKVDRSTDLISRYGNDGFNVFSGDTELIPVSHTTFRDERSGAFILRFDYEKGSKTFVINDTPYYDFEVQYNFSEPVSMTFPYISNTKTFDPNSYHMSYLKKPKSLMTLYSNDVTFSDGVLNSKSGSGSIKVYAGPIKLIYISEALPELYDTVKKNLSEVGALSFFSYIHHGLVVFLYYLFKLTGSFGWAIILFTLVVRLILYPLYHIQTKSMIEMRKIQPEIEKLRKKYKDPQKQQQALMALYREKHINPATGCLTLLIQLPVFFVLYSVIRYFSEMFAYAPKFLFWSDLSTGGFLQNSLLIFISIITGIYLATVTSQDGKTARQSMIMSLVFPFLFYTLPTGLFIYYATNSILQLLITIYVYRKFGMKGISMREVFGLPPKPAK
ncbi:MAG: YidC/Oxa1 family membrane protein insertase [Kosmotoga sp.]|uniref:YidC/Oxa1 family membrane protein insertase n=1 Tax=Kosmotoga sp. TaxID=1955248 RepID=UPI0025C3D0F0|nr:YidC/Oxa1 family membrane protein insertase [Kosmotoga sp.]MCD6159236.1 YidC/Oxa1 family membrane protein insertase [Kosmotoga sp.]